MRISDWSSDVCSSDLAIVVLHHLADRRLRRRAVAERDLHLEQLARDLGLGFLLELAKLLQLVAHREHGIDAGEAAGAPHPTLTVAQNLGATVFVLDQRVFAIIDVAPEQRLTHRSAP